MIASIYRSEIKGKVIAPPSKSYTLRGLICAALAKGNSEIIQPLGSDDTEAAIAVLNKIGTRVLQEEGSWKVSGSYFTVPTEELYCRESAVTLRFMTAISSLIPGQSRLTSSPSLSRRPIEPLIQALKQLGIDCSQEKDGTIIVNESRSKGGIVCLPGNISSQFVSALLLISPLAEEGISIRLTTPLESQPYVLMTIECLKKYGVKVNYSGDFREFTTLKQDYQPAKYRVEGDWSSASYLLALGALAGSVEVANLNLESLQGDKAILGLLGDMGASITTDKDSIIIKKSDLTAINTDLTDCTDLLPTVAILAATAKGTSVLTGIERARLKESDRPSALSEGLKKMGVEVTEANNKLTITGPPAREAAIDTRGDHRIAMAFSLLGIKYGKTKIHDAECVSKTYPEYWDTLKSIGGEVKTNGK
ncbi:3-phosphoshikimate 1-carboxyvinyltransferase [Chloroflexota bacterium]